MSIDLIDPRVGKLPKWAQAELDTLTRNVDYWKAIALAGEGETDTVLSIGAYESKSLKDGQRVTFGAEWVEHRGRRFTRNGIEVRWDADHAVLHVHGGNRIAIHPEASNSLTITKVER